MSDAPQLPRQQPLSATPKQQVARLIQYALTATLVCFPFNAAPRMLTDLTALRAFLDRATPPTYDEVNLFFETHFQNYYEVDPNHTYEKSQQRFLAGNHFSRLLNSLFETLTHVRGPYDEEQWRNEVAFRRANLTLADNEYVLFHDGQLVARSTDRDAIMEIFHSQCKPGAYIGSNPGPPLHIS